MRSQWIVAVLGLSVTAGAQTNVSGGPLIAEMAAYDVAHYDLALAVDPAKKSIRGRLTMRAEIVAASERVALDLDDRLAVTGVTVDGRPASFEQRDGRIWITIGEVGRGETIEVAVDYGGAPRVAPRPPWEGGFTWARTSDGKPWIATSCQGEGADLWWPCKDQPSDKPATMDLHITVPEGLFCASNGTLQSDRADGNGNHTLHWHIANPISNYNVALNIAPYVVVEGDYQSVTGEDIPIYFWVLPRNRGKAEKSLPEFLDHLRFFEEVCGPYPFRNEKYGIVETPHLGMEHQTIIAYGNKWRRGPFDYDWLHHHELSHEWWANLVTCRDWKDMWIHEGFGTYMQALYIERKHGRKAYLTEMASKRRTINNRKAVAPRESQNSKQIYFGADGAHDNDIYYKGSCILHTLRWQLGDEVFFEFLRRMAYPTPEFEKALDGSQVRLVDTGDVRRTAEELSGQELGWFFEVYLRQPALPLLKVDERGDRVRLQWQAPGDLPFPMAVPVRVGDDLERIEMTDGSGVFERRGSYQIDPENWVLKR